MSHLRIPEFEKAIIGAMLRDPLLVIDRLIGYIGEDDFTEFITQRIFQIVIGFYREGKPIAVDSVSAEMRRTSLAADMTESPYEFLAGLWYNSPPQSNIEYYRDKLADATLFRTLGRISLEIKQAVENPEGSAKQTLEKFVTLLSAIEKTGGEEPERIGKITERVLDRINERSQPGAKQNRFIKSDFETFNASSGGFLSKQLVLLGARPGIGKSALLLQLASRFAKDGNPVLFFNLEMTNDETGERMLSQETGLNSAYIRGVNNPSQIECNRLMTAYRDVLKDMNLYSIDRASMLPAEIAAISRRYARKKGVRVIMIDYAQLIESENKRDNRATVVGAISRSLKMIAKENDLLVIAAAQLNRGPDQRTEPRPKLSDFRESGGLEQDADIAWLLHSLNDSDTNTKKDYELIIPKNRNGPKGIQPLFFNGSIFKFEERHDGIV